MEKKEKIELYKKNLKSMADGEINELSLDFDIVWDDINDLASEFPSLSFNVKGELVNVYRKKN